MHGDSKQCKKDFYLFNSKRAEHISLKIGIVELCCMETMEQSNVLSYIIDLLLYLLKVFMTSVNPSGSPCC